MKRRAAIYLATPEGDRRPDRSWEWIRLEASRQAHQCATALGSANARFAGLFSDPVMPNNGGRFCGTGLKGLLHSLSDPDSPSKKIDLVIADEVLEGSSDLDQIAATGVEVLLIGDDEPETSEEL